MFFSIHDKRHVLLSGRVALLNVSEFSQQRINVKSDDLTNARYESNPFQDWNLLSYFFINTSDMLMSNRGTPSYPYLIFLGGKKYLT